MPRKKSKDEFVEVSSHIHKNKYDYSKVDYINSQTKVCIICPKHGEFWQTPAAHIHQQQGCSKCRSDNMKTKVSGIGINDYEGLTKIKGKSIQSYHIWREMLSRCYDPKSQQRYPSYIGCSVCEEWLYFSNFKQWFDENYIEGYSLDKDILVKGNKVYSPQTCCFVPRKINSLLVKREAERGDYAIGVVKKGNCYIARLSRGGRQEHIGCFKTEYEAFIAYKEAREAWIKEVATQALLRKEISEKVYNALVNYKVEITD